MGSRTYISVAAGISLFILASTARAQDEQWLQYHSEREAQRIIGDMSTMNLKLLSERLQGVELPDFKCDEPFFASWSTPMVESGRLCLASGGFHISTKNSYPASAGKRVLVCGRNIIRTYVNSF